MGKRNKKRYQAEVKPAILIACTGKIFLQYRDEEEISAAQKGDLMLFPSVEALHTLRQGEYEHAGYAGYFRVDVHDGRAWQPVQLAALFAEREHYFSKTERPIDTFELCASLLAARMPLALQRTYREHYTVAETED